MSNKWCVEPTTVTVELKDFVAPDGTPAPFWVKFKQQLTVGELKKMSTAGWRGLVSNDAGRGDIKVDFSENLLARVSAYLQDWSLDDADKVRLPLTRDTIEALHPKVFDAIDAALTAHIEKMEQEKKVPNGVPAQSQT